MHKKDDAPAASLKLNICTAREYGGTGLGLAISKQLIELMGGGMGVSSAPDAGSTFWFTGTFEKQPEGAEANIQPTGAVASRARILVAEDNIVNQIVALGQLENLGYEGQAVSDGREALREFEKEHFDIILMDCQMPEMDGFEATAQIRLREGSSARHTTIIAMTAHAVEGDREKCLAAGMDDYLSKPVKTDTLKLMLEHWLKPASGADSAFEKSTSAATESASMVKLLRVESMAIGGDSSSSNKGDGGVDLSVLAAYQKIQRPDEPDLVMELIDLFLKDATEQILILHEAVSANDVEEVRQIAHLLKGSCGNIGAGGMAILTQKLEAKGIAKDDAEVLLRQLDEEFGRVRKVLGERRMVFNKIERMDGECNGIA